MHRPKALLASEARIVKVQVMNSVSPKIRQSCAALMLMAMLSGVLSGCSFFDTYGKIRKLEKAPVVFPEIITAIEDEGIKSHWNRPVSMPLYVIFIDSVECSDCHLNYVKNYSKLFDLSRKSNKFAIVCVVSPSYEAREGLCEKLLNYNKLTKITYIIDKKNQFYERNSHVPKHAKYHKFLLDKEGYPVFVGNPLRNDKLFNQFLKLVL